MLVKLSAQKIIDIFGLPTQFAIRIARLCKYATRSSDHDAIDKVLEECNQFIHGYGIESIQLETAWVDNYYQNICLLYVNMGDTYAPTIMYDTRKDTFYIGDWETWVEVNNL